jgi:hypothetical protein
MDIPDSPPSDPVPCMIVADVALVPHVKALLESAGILYFVKHEAAHYLHRSSMILGGFDPVVGPPVVMVEASRLEEARCLLEDLMRAIGEEAVAPPAGRQPTSCSRCSRPLEQEEDDAPLSHCYHCGFPLDEAR